jgi:hypothetical protein
MAFEELKSKQSVMWGTGPYPNITERRVSHLRVPSGEDYWQLFSTSYAPTRTLAESLDDDRREEFHQAWIEFFESNYRRNGEIDHDREWLLVYGIRR